MLYTEIHINSMFIRPTFLGYILNPFQKIEYNLGNSYMIKINSTMYFDQFITFDALQCAEQEQKVYSLGSNRGHLDFVFDFLRKINNFWCFFTIRPISCADNFVLVSNRIRRYCNFLHGCTDIQDLYSTHPYRKMTWHWFCTNNKI